MEDEARARMGVVVGSERERERERERDSHLKPWACRNGERSKPKPAVTHGRGRENNPNPKL